MLPTSEELEITCTTSVSHPWLSKSPTTLNTDAEFIFHTSKADPSPEVILKLSEKVAESKIFLYNWCRTKEVAARLNGVLFAESFNGLDWQEIDVSITDLQIYDGLAIPILLNPGKKYLKLFRIGSGEPIHLRQITIGQSLEDLHNASLKLTRIFADQHELPIDSDGYIIENTKTTNYLDHRMLVRTARPIKTESGLNIKAVYVNKLGRFSNGLIQIVNALRVAQNIGARRVYINPNPNARSMFPSGDPVQYENTDIEIRFEKPIIDEIFLEGNFLYNSISKNLYQSSLTNYEIVQGFKSGLEFNSVDPLNSDVIVIHIRSGDIFGNNPHPGYGQPPFAYYRVIIEKINPKHVYVVYENNANPVIDELIRYLMLKEIPYTIQSASLREDISLLLRARKIIAGRGSFISGVLALSKNIEQVYFFNQKSYIFENKKVEYIVVKDVRKTYTDAILNNNWINSIEQRQLMLDYPADYLAVTV